MEYNTAGNPMPVTNMPSCSNGIDPSLTSSTTFDIGPASTFTDHFRPTGSMSYLIRGSSSIPYGPCRCLHFSALNGRTAAPFNANTEQILNGGPASSVRASRVGSLAPELPHQDTR